MNARPLDQAALELAALYALSALATEEMAAVERDYRDHTGFWQEVRSLRDAAAGLAETGPRAKPKGSLWPAIRARIGLDGGPTRPAASQVWKDWAGNAAADAHILMAGGSPFEDTSIEGIRVRRLFVDEPADRITMLVEMDPGTAYPAHRHGGVEECFVVRGDLAIDERVEMHAGDYQRMESGSRHGVQSTRAGCLLLVVSSRHDELE
jgi:quercetin dioxygenase-like cupin family protein